MKSDDDELMFKFDEPIYNTPQKKDANKGSTPENGKELSTLEQSAWTSAVRTTGEISIEQNFPNAMTVPSPDTPPSEPINVEKEPSMLPLNTEHYKERDPFKAAREKKKTELKLRSSGSRLYI